MSKQTRETHEEGGKEETKGKVEDLGVVGKTNVGQNDEKHV